MTELTYWVAILLLAFCAPSVKATAITYIYTGNDYTVAGFPYTTSMAVTAFFTFASPLAANIVYPAPQMPVVWSISDGIETITNNSGPLLVLDIGTDSSENITTWEFATYFTVSTGILAIASTNVPLPSFPCGNNACDVIYGVAAGHSVGIAGVVNDPGTWTPTPEPSSVLLMAIGTFAMTRIARKRCTVAYG